MNDVQRTLTEMIVVAEKDVVTVGAHAHLDPAYLRKWLSGEKCNPSGRALIKAWQGVIMDPAILERDPSMIYGLERLIIAAATTAATFQGAETHLWPAVSKKRVGTS
jgi:hypothetical protein